MTGAETLVRTLVAAGLDTCFANPGTSEMHLVAALDRIPGLRCVLGLAEGVVTGAADGYARMTGRPAATLLHLGPGLANGVTNLHNARKAGSPILNIVGDHATFHRALDAPLTADVEGIAAPVSHWVRTSRDPARLAGDAAEALSVVRRSPGQIATLIVPANIAWSEAGDAPPAPVPPPAAATRVDDDAVRTAAHRLTGGENAVLYVGGVALTEPALSVAARVAAKTGARLFGPTSAARAACGAGRPIVARIPYVVDRALATLAGTRHAVLCGVPAPVNFFAYPGKPSVPLPPDCTVTSIADRHGDLLEALLRLEDAVGARTATPPLQARADTTAPGGALTLDGLGRALAALMPEGAILVEESISSSFTLLPLLRGAPAHDLLQLTGGAIGIGFPLATGAAIAAPDRKTILLEADGSGMYNPQALWTQARERADVVTVVLANRTYATLFGELANVGINQAGAQASAMFDLGNPTLDWVGLARAMGVEARRATTMEVFNGAFAEALSGRGPFLIEAVL